MHCSIKKYYRVRTININFKSMKIQIYLFYSIKARSVWWYSCPKIKQEKERGNWNKQQKVWYAYHCFKTHLLKAYFTSLLLSQLMANGRLITYPVTGVHAQYLVEKERQLVSFPEAVPIQVLNMAVKTVLGDTLKQKPSPATTGSVQVILVFFFLNQIIQNYICLLYEYCLYILWSFIWIIPVVM